MKHPSAHRQVRSARWLVSAGLLLLSVAHAQSTLYERLGGTAKLKAAVNEFIPIMQADDRINFTFADTDLTKFKQLLFEQLCALAKGPCQYSGRDMGTAHAKLDISDAQFNALTEDLYVALERVHVPYRLQNQLVALLAPMERDIIKPGFVPENGKVPANVR